MTTIINNSFWGGVKMLLLVALLFGKPASAQLSYQFSATQSTYVGLLNSAKIISPNSTTNLSGTISMPFSFLFEDKNYTSFKIAKNGWITLGNETQSGMAGSGLSYDYSFIKPPLVAALWTAMEADSIKIQLQGKKPERKIIIEWANIHLQQMQLQNFSCQIILYEKNSTIELAYNNSMLLKKINQPLAIGIKGTENKTDFLSVDLSLATPKINLGVENNNASNLPTNNDLFRFETIQIPMGSLLKSGLCGWWKADNEYIKLENENKISSWQPCNGTIKFEQLNTNFQPVYLAAENKPKLFNHHASVSFSKDFNSQLESELDNTLVEKWQTYFIVKYNEIVSGSSFNENRCLSFSKPSGSFFSKKMKINMGNSFLTNDNNISEILIFDRKLNTTESKIIKSYLALKYGISRSAKNKLKNYYSSEGTKIWDAENSDGYNNSVAGICRDDNFNFNQSVATSNNDYDALNVNTKPYTIVSDGTAITLAANNSFLIWGCNGTLSAFSEQAVIKNDLPSGILNRMACVYKFSATNFQQFISVAFDKSKLLGCNNYDALRLLIDDDGNFGNAENSAVQPIVTANQVVFNNVPLKYGNVFYLTLGMNGANEKYPSYATVNVAENKRHCYDAVLPASISTKRKKTVKTIR